MSETALASTKAFGAKLSVGFPAGVTTAGLTVMACVVGALGVGNRTTGYCCGYATYW